VKLVHGDEAAVASIAKPRGALIEEEVAAPAAEAPAAAAE